jgi:predicted nuclease of predicted toxin-antitoxin system
VKLLLDENLSPKLIDALKPEYPGSTHVRAVGLRGATDERIWNYAREQGFAIVSKDNDFRQLSFVHSAPPKVIWLSVGNAGTDAILHFLKSQRVVILTFDADKEASLLVLPLPETGI